MRKPRVAAVQSMTPCQADVQKFQTRLVSNVSAVCFCICTFSDCKTLIAKRILNPKTRKLSGIHLCQISHSLFRGRQWCQNKLQSSSGLAKWNLQMKQHHVISNHFKPQAMSKALIATAINDDASSAAVLELH